MTIISFNSNIIRYARTYNLNIHYQKSSINSLDKRIHMTVRFLHLHFKFTFTFTFHPFTTTEYYLLLLLSPDNLFTFLPFYFFTFKRVPTQPLLHPDAIFRTSRRSHRYVGTQFQMHREGVKNTENPGCNSERRTFRFVKYLPVVFGIVNFLPVCASTV